MRSHRIHVLARTVRIRSVLTAGLGVLLLAAGLAAQQPTAPPDSAQPSTADGAATEDASLEQRIQQLIDQLGADEYATRERAQSELSQLGLAAYDALQDALQHEDVEVSLRARYLLRSMQVSWAVESDPGEVRTVLQDYGSQSSRERKNRIERLAKLPGGAGTVALARLARFEIDKRLAKRAALLLMLKPVEESGLDAAEKSDAVLEILGGSRRRGAMWIRTYVRTLGTPEESLEEWEALVADEQETFARFPERTSPELVRDLLRWQVGLYTRAGESDKAEATIYRTLDLVDGSREQLIEMVDWLMQREAWKLVDEVADRNPEQFQQDLMLKYRLAESQLRRGAEEAAQKTADEALELVPDHYEEHIVAAVSLQERGLFDWAEREYRRVIEKNEGGSVHNLKSRFLLSEMLHDNLRELDAAKVLQDVVDVIDADKVVLQRIQQPPLSRNPGSIRSRMHFFYARHFADQDDREQQLKHLREGIQHDEADADLLIAMYRVPNADEEWMQKTKERIEKASTDFHERINQLRDYVKQVPNESQRYNINRALAYVDNQYAWLVANTEGNYQEALRCSLESNELVPDSAGYLDTLGRCFYAVKDYENAVKYQSMAVELEPHSGQITRQLEMFKQALAEQKAAADQAEGEPGETTGERQGDR